MYLLTHVTSIGAVVLYGRLLTDPSVAAGLNVRVGALLEIILALAVIGTAVALYPVVKPHGEAVALGYVGLRTLEATVITVGVLPLLARSWWGARRRRCRGGSRSATGAAQGVPASDRRRTELRILVRASWFQV